MNDVIIEEIMKENKQLFSENELTVIDKNIKIVKKIYLIGLINARQIYKET